MIECYENASVVNIKKSLGNEERNQKFEVS